MSQVADEHASEDARWAALWGSGVFVHRSLDHIVRKGPPDHDFSDRIREAFIALESRLRQIGGVGNDMIGAELVDAIFHPTNGVLQPISQAKSENVGIHHLFHGAFLYYRNPNAHHTLPYDQKEAWSIFHLINTLLQTLEAVAEMVVDIREFVAQHEGKIVRRRDFRLDVDNDGENELVLLLEAAGIVDEEEEKLPGLYSGRLLTVILDKQGETFRRLPCQAMPGVSIYGFSGVRLLHVTGTDRPDLVINWATGVSGGILFIERWVEQHYEIVRLQPTELLSPWGSPQPEDRFFTHHSQYGVDLVDFDGDGIAEVVQRLRFEGKQLIESGHKSADPAAFFNVYRIWKWHDGEQKLTFRSEHVVAVNLPALPSPFIA